MRWLNFALQARSASRKFNAKKTISAANSDSQSRTAHRGSGPCNVSPHRRRRSFVIDGSVTDHLGNEPAEAGDAGGPHPDFDRGLLVTASKDHQQQQQSNRPNASNEDFGGHGLLRCRFAIRPACCRSIGPGSIHQPP
jgi:hypothetical protein